ncbi:hypothetical protein HPB49_011186 [Dermacentor silvarum]|uniref:Uncharacterized protein n=1 Tax=Dermacentor silvarum TaxID=543639 RepID=A0ACB8DZD5_DERSI|nr:hypothetical protein HPB49_011186 [Dermacentor silvarum]
MTARLSTDSAEHMFGIIQSSGCNAHPSPDQFLVTVNCLSFYNMARSLDGANGTSDIINALLSVDDKTPNISPNSVDELLAQGRLLDGSLSDCQLSTLVCVGKRYGQPEPLHDRTIRHRESLLPASIKDFLPIPGALRHPLPTTPAESRELSNAFRRFTFQDHS